MNDSIKEKIMTELERRLLLIGPPNYWTDVRVVNRTQGMLPERVTAPTAYLYEGEEEKEDGITPLFLECKLPIGIIYVSETQRDRARFANRMLQDLEVAVGLEYHLTCPSGNTVTVYLRMKTTEIQVDDQGGPTVAATCIFEAQYRHAPGNPADVVCA
jgi:hypothetical protein